MTHRNILEDTELVRSAQQGRLEAFTALYERYLPLVYGRVRCAIPAQDVEDVTQEVFIAVVRSLKNFRHESRFSTWLRTLVNRQIADYYRSRKGYIANQLSIDSENIHVDWISSFSTGDHVDTTHEMIIVRQAMQNLPDNYREILLLRFAEGLRFDEIAQQQGQSLEATKSLFRRAVAALQKRVANG